MQNILNCLFFYCQICFIYWRIRKVYLLEEDKDIQDDVSALAKLYTLDVPQLQSIF